LYLSKLWGYADPISSADSEPMTKVQERLLSVKVSCHQCSCVPCLRYRWLHMRGALLDMARGGRNRAPPCVDKHSWLTRTSTDDLAQTSVWLTGVFHTFSHQYSCCCSNEMQLLPFCAALAFLAYTFGVSVGHLGCPTYTVSFTGSLAAIGMGQIVGVTGRSGVFMSVGHCTRQWLSTLWNGFLWGSWKFKSSGLWMKQL
jgi:hypothetical protein